MERITALVSSIGLLTAGMAAAATTSGGSGSMTDIFTGAPISEGTGTSSAFLEQETIPDLVKFDPSLGTLTEIKFTTSYEFNFQLDVVVSDPIDGSDFFDGSAEISSDAGIYLFTNGGTSVATIDAGFINVYAEALGNPGDPDAFGGDQGFTESVSADSFIAPANFAAFTGVGPMNDAFAGIFFPTDSASTLSNADTIEISGDASLTNISYSVLYTFTPIPEPSGALLCVCSACLAVFRRGRSS